MFCSNGFDTMHVVCTDLLCVVCIICLHSTFVKLFLNLFCCKLLSRCNGDRENKLN